MKKLGCLIAALFLPGLLLRAGPARCEFPETAPRWSFEVQTAQLFGVNNPEDYYLSAQYLTLVYRFDRAPWSVAGIFLTPELALSAVGEAVLHGPENHYFGGALRTRAIFARPASKWSVYLEVGAGAGAIDSTGTRYGQGQDFTFNILAGAGLRYALTERCTVGLGVHYQHLSNADLSEPETRNTGLDAFGPSLTAGFAF